jgi:RES domain-containing protein
MVAGGRIHDRELLDSLEKIPSVQFANDVWRVTRKGREALRGSAANGRWSPGGEFEVLYTSLEREGALAEIGYRLNLEPIWPSRMLHEIHTIAAAVQQTLRFADVASLAPLGVDEHTYDRFDYQATQAIAAAAHFLEFDGLIVPSARAPCSNLVIFMDRSAANGELDVRVTEDIDWTEWRRSRDDRLIR